MNIRKKALLRLFFFFPFWSRPHHVLRMLQVRNISSESTRTSGGNLYSEPTRVLRTGGKNRYKNILSDSYESGSLRPTGRASVHRCDVVHGRCSYSGPQQSVSPNHRKYRHCRSPRLPKNRTLLSSHSLANRDRSRLWRNHS